MNHIKRFGGIPQRESNSPETALGVSLWTYRLAAGHMAFLIDAGADGTELVMVTVDLKFISSDSPALAALVVSAAM